MECQRATRERSLGCSLSIAYSESQEDKQIKLTDIDFLLKRYSQTKQDIDVLSYQLMLDKNFAERVVYVAAEVERISGFEFYQASFVNKDKLLDKNSFQLKESKKFKAENERVTEILKGLDVYISELNSNELNEINLGLNVWKKTLRANINIITDLDEKSALELLVNRLGMGMELSAFEEKNIKKDEGSVLIPLAFEKNKGRRGSRTAVKIIPGFKLKTQQVVCRIMFLLNVYLKMNFNF